MGQFWRTLDVAGERCMKLPTACFGQRSPVGLRSFVEEAVHRLTTMALPVVVVLCFQFLGSFDETQKLFGTLFQLTETGVDLPELLTNVVNFRILRWIDANQGLQLSLILLELLGVFLLAALEGFLSLP